MNTDADIFKTQRYSFLHKDTNKPNRVCDLQMRSRMLSLAVFYRAFFYDAVVSNFIKFHITTKVYPNDERCESIYSKDYDRAIVRLSRSVPKKGCANPSSPLLGCVRNVMRA